VITHENLRFRVTDRAIDPIRKKFEASKQSEPVLGLVFATIRDDSTGNESSRWLVQILNRTSEFEIDGFNFEASGFDIYCFHGDKNWALEFLNGKMIDYVDRLLVIVPDPGDE